MPDNGGGVLSTVGGGITSLLKAVANVSGEVRRNRDREQAFRVQMAEEDPRLLSLPEIAKAYDKALGAEGAHMIKLAEWKTAQEQQKALLGALGIGGAAPGGAEPTVGAQRSATRTGAGLVQTESMPTTTRTAAPVAPGPKPSGTFKTKIAGGELSLKIGDAATRAASQDVGTIIENARKAYLEGDVQKAHAYMDVLHNKTASVEERQRAFATFMSSILLGRHVEQQEIKPIPAKTLGTWEWQKPGAADWSAVPPMPNFSSADFEALQKQGFKFREKGSQVPLIGPLLKPAGQPFPTRGPAPEVKPTPPAAPTATPKATEAGALPHNFFAVDEP